MLKWLEGKKTIIMCILVGVTAALQYLGVEIPPWVYAIEAALGGAFMKAGQNREAKKAVE